MIFSHIGQLQPRGYTASTLNCSYLVWWLKHVEVSICTCVYHFLCNSVTIKSICGQAWIDNVAFRSCSQTGQERPVLVDVLFLDLVIVSHIIYDTPYCVSQTITERGEHAMERNMADRRGLLGWSRDYWCIPISVSGSWHIARDTSCLPLNTFYLSPGYKWPFDAFFTHENAPQDASLITCNVRYVRKGRLRRLKMMTMILMSWVAGSVLVPSNVLILTHLSWFV